MARTTTSSFQAKGFAHFLEPISMCQYEIRFYGAKGVITIENLEARERWYSTKYVFYIA